MSEFYLTYKLIIKSYSQNSHYTDLEGENLIICQSFEYHIPVLAFLDGLLHFKFHRLAFSLKFCRIFSEKIWVLDTYFIC
jgi:hypothetical protein